MKRSRNILMVICFLGLATSAASALAQNFGHKGGPDIANITEIINLLREDTYDLELLLSFGTSKGGSAGHLALAIRDQVPGDDLVYSANFYADRKPKHSQGYYNRDLICMVPKSEYLFKTTSSLGADASFGLDMGEIYKRSVIGIRISGVPKDVRDGLTAFFNRLNDDFRARKKKTSYLNRPIVYGYMNLNCAKTVALAFRHGAGFRDLHIKGADLISKLNIISATKAGIPTETAMEIIKSCAARGYRFDVVMYKKWDGSTYVNPKDEDGRMYKDLPNRFPSVLSLDYREDQGNYEDYDNLYSMYLLYHLGRCSIVLDSAARLLKVEARKEPDTYKAAKAMADRSATEDKKHLLRRLIFRTWGIKLGGDVDNNRLYNYDYLDTQDDSKPAVDSPSEPVINILP
ncbi:MAG: hypothetical protein AB2L11_00030 [Syntrophobacteraceae bacterium]